MMRPVIFTAFVTGLFCLGFAAVVDALTDALPMMVALGLAFCSGFLGSLFAQLILKRHR